MGVVEGNPHVDVLHVRLNSLGQGDLAHTILKETLSHINKPIKYHTTRFEGGAVQFASTKPKAKQWTDEGWEESQTIKAMRCLSSRDKRAPPYLLTCVVFGARLAPTSRT